MFDWIGGAVQAVTVAYLVKTMPGWILLMLVAVLAGLIAWMHRNPRIPWSYSIAYFRDFALTLALLVLLGVGLASILGFLKVG